jgi:hypothetical protein
MVMMTAVLALTAVLNAAPPKTLNKVELTPGSAYGQMQYAEERSSAASTGLDSEASASVAESAFSQAGTAASGAVDARSRHTGTLSDGRGGRGPVRPPEVLKSGMVRAAAIYKAEEEEPFPNWAHPGKWSLDSTAMAAVGGLIGAAIGFAVGGPIGAAAGFLVGLLVGALVARMRSR